MTVHRGRWSLEDRLVQGLRELPFDVPPGTASVTVELSHEGGVIDLGCHGPNGFRGWSGGARSRYTISADWATLDTCQVNSNRAYGTSGSGFTAYRPMASRMRSR